MARIKPITIEVITKMNEKPFYKSKKFWVMIITALITVFRPMLREKYGIDIPLETILAPTGYIIGQGIADGKKVEINNNADKK